MRARLAFVLPFMIVAGCRSDDAADKVVGVYVVAADRAPAHLNPGLRRGSDDLVPVEEWEYDWFFGPKCSSTTTKNSLHSSVFSLVAKTLYLRAGADGEPKRIAIVEDMWPSPDGRKILFQRPTTSATAPLHLADAKTTSEVKLAASEDSVLKFDPAWSRDGRRFAFQNGNDIWVVDGAGHHGFQLTRPPDGYEDRCATWLKGGHTIGFLRQAQPDFP